MKRSAHFLLAIAVSLPFVLGQLPTATAHPLSNARSTPHTAAQGRNSIAGHVFDDSRRPLGDVFIELLDDLGITANRTKTNSSGRYEFAGLPEGRFKVRVLPFATDYAEQIQEVLISNVSAVGGGTGGENRQVDFYLRLRPDANAGPFYVPGTIFVQEVPKEAERFFERGVSELREKKEIEAFGNLKKAIEVFPKYFQALDRLGTEYAARGKTNTAYFEAGRILLTKAIEVNPRSYSSTFGLGFAYYHLGMNNEAVENLQRAINLYNKSINGYLWLGIALKRAGKLVEAEQALVRANQLGKGRVADVHWQLARLYTEQKRHNEAANELELFLKSQPDSRDAEKIRQMIAELRKRAVN